MVSAFIDEELIIAGTAGETPAVPATDETVTSEYCRHKLQLHTNKFSFQTTQAREPAIQADGLSRQHSL
jgi:hypothetical protein